MSAVPDKSSGSETQTLNLETKGPALQLVEDNVYFRSVALEEEVEDCLGLEVNDERVNFVMQLVTNPTPTSVNFLEDITASDKTELLELSVLITPKILKQAVESGTLEDSELDRVRNVLARLMTHPDEDIQELAQAAFTAEAPRLAERDTVSYHWLGWLGIKKPNLVIRTYSSDIAIKSKALLA